jgi:hypothetical protein
VWENCVRRVILRGDHSSEHSEPSRTRIKGTILLISRDYRIHMRKKQKRGVIQLTITILLSIYFWVQVPFWEKMILEIIAKDPNAMSHFGNYWIKIVYFLIQYWELISFIILLESLYAIIYNRDLIPDIVKEIKKKLK